ncbi:TetR/AcrR family transcriptional regulator [Ornithinicoccus halotolerans]|uniref:TetR/AcrR family transcriptional regulator n=1 Tax=Ornithinicoccus halotolerans TaxID=1748220 RepID=UPI001E50653A|nr:TetR/AcrR family transcriptional regulator [Ornithinicoccus halotolerans]
MNATAGAHGPAALTPAALRILEVASDLFYHRGINATGVDTIAEESGVTKRTLYNQFGSKDGLVLAYLRRRDRTWRELVEQAVRAPGLSPPQRVLAPFTALRAWLAENPRGCAFVNAFAELADPGHPAHRLAAEEKRWLQDLFAELLAAAGVARPEDRATQLACLHEGALVLHAMAPDPDVLGSARRAAAALLESGDLDGSPQPAQPPCSGTNR